MVGGQPGLGPHRSSSCSERATVTGSTSASPGAAAVWHFPQPRPVVAPSRSAAPTAELPPRCVPFLQRQRRAGVAVGSREKGHGGHHIPGKATKKPSWLDPKASRLWNRQQERLELEVEETPFASLLDRRKLVTLLWIQRRGINNHLPMVWKMWFLIKIQILLSFLSKVMLSQCVNGF